MTPRASTHADYATALAATLQPPPILTVSEWADANRILPKGSAEPGRWRTSRTPYLREVMDRLSSHDPCRRVYFQKGSQIGASEAINNWLGMTIDNDPCPFMIVQPTEATAIKYSKMRVAKMLRASPTLSAKVRDRAKESGNTLLEKEFPGGSLTMVGANAPSGLASVPIKRLACDEVDRFPPSAGSEGDPIGLAEVRTTTFFDAKIFHVSTPTVEGQSRIEAGFNQTGRRYYRVPCPHCDERQVLRWQGVQWQRGKPETAVYVCEHCGAEIEEWQKRGMLDAGQWVAEYPELEDGFTYGYHLSALYSPWLTWAAMAREFMAAKGDPIRLQVFVNTRLGETWAESDGRSVQGHTLLARRHAFEAPAPDGVALITCGVDCQADRLELEVVGWGLGYESWSIDHRVLPGDPSGLQVWADLERFLTEQTYTRPDGQAMPIMATAIDSGGHNTQSVYEFCKPRHMRRIWAVKGASTTGRPVWPQRPTKSNRLKCPLYVLGVDAAKEHVYARLTIEAPGPGFCHFPPERTEGYFEQLTAETRRKGYNRKTGAHVWYWFLASGKRNEALDLRVYAYASLLGLLALGYDLNRELSKWQGGNVKPKKPQTAKRPPRLGGKKGWLR